MSGRDALSPDDRQERAGPDFGRIIRSLRRLAINCPADAVDGTADVTITLACAGETASYLTVMIAGKQAWLNKAGCTVVGPGKDWVTVQMTRAQAAGGD